MTLSPAAASECLVNAAECQLIYYGHYDGRLVM